MNVTGATQAARLALSQGSRLVLASGFMVENREHQRHLGIDPDRPERTDWPRVYRKAGAYEASKLESHYAVVDLMQKAGGDLTIVHPATVCGHSQSGAIAEGQPLAALILNLIQGRLKAIPGSPDHWLPLVTVDFLANLMAAAALDPDLGGKTLLALDSRTPSLGEMLQVIGHAVARPAPSRHMPLPVLAGILAVPGLERWLNTRREALNFIQRTRFDTTATETIARERGLEWPDMRKAIEATARYLQARTLSIATTKTPLHRHL